MSYRTGQEEVYVIDLATRAITQVTHDGDGFGSGWSAAPAWSPDGTRLAYDYDPRAGDWRICIADIDRANQVSNRRCYPDLSGEYGNPTWSPSGDSIVYNSHIGGGNFEIYRVDFDRNWNVVTETRLTNDSADDHWPDWDPYGGQVVFRSDRPGNRELYAMDAFSGGNLTRLTYNATVDDSPKLSSDGRRIAYTCEFGGSLDICVADVIRSGSRIVGITNTSRIITGTANDFDPSWSSGGQWLAFVSDRDGDQEIWVAKVDGTNLMTITDNTVVEAHPAWAPGAADTTPPAAITDLAAQKGDAPGTVRLTWTAPGDDGNIGRAASYIVKYSSTTTVTEATWNTAITVTTGVPDPQPAGVTQTMVVGGLAAGQRHYFAIKTQDERSNTSGLSNPASSYPKEPSEALLYLEPMSRTVCLGETFTMSIRVDPKGNLVDGAQAYLDFNPGYLRVVDEHSDETSRIIPGSVLPDVIQNQADNIQGKINYAAGIGIGGSPVAGDFLLAIIHFKAAGEITPTTPITFSLVSPRQTKVVYQGFSITTTVQDGGVAIVADAPVSIQPSTKIVAVGQIFTLTISVHSGSRPVDAAQAYLDFDPAYLRVVAADGTETGTIITGSALPDVLQNSASNSSGQINYAAGIGTGGRPVSGTFTLAVIRFKAISETTRTDVMFNFTSLRKTKVVYQGATLPGRHEDGRVEVSPPLALQGRVWLERPGIGSGPSWSVPLRVKLYQPGSLDAIATYTATTTITGGFTITGITPGSYDIRVKNPHTLRNLRRDVLVSSFSEMVDFGTLLEGDCNDDNVVDILDYSGLVYSFGTAPGYPRWRPNCDLNEDDVIDISDYSMLLKNFGRAGVPPYGSATGLAVISGPTIQGMVDIGIQPMTSSVTVGDVFTVNIVFQAGSQLVDGGQAYIDFDRTYLRVVDAQGNESSSIITGSTLPDVVRNLASNSQGTIEYAAGIGIGGTPVTGTFTLASIRLKAVAETTGTQIGFSTDPPRQTRAAYEGNAVTGLITDGWAMIESILPYKCYLPMVMKQTP